MPASMSSVTTMGFGNGTFEGSIYLVASLGYGFGEEAIIPGGFYYYVFMTNSVPV